MGDGDMETLGLDGWRKRGKRIDGWMYEGKRLEDAVTAHDTH